MMHYWWFFIPFLSALTGWLIHRTAIHFLFHPRTPRKFIAFTVQGLIPKRRNAITQKLGSLAASEFQSFSGVLEKKITDPAALAKLMPVIETHVDDFLRVKLAEKMPVISMFIGDKTVNTLKTVFMQELEGLFPKVMGQFAGGLKDEMDIKKMVSERLTNVSDEELEKQLRIQLATQFRMWTLLGAFSGFAAGLVVLLLLLVNR